MSYLLYRISKYINGRVLVFFCRGLKCVFLHKTSKYECEAKPLGTGASAQRSLGEVIWKLQTPVFVGVRGKLNTGVKTEPLGRAYKRRHAHAEREDPCRCKQFCCSEPRVTWPAGIKMSAKRTRPKQLQQDFSIFICLSKKETIVCFITLLMESLLITADFGPFKRSDKVKCLFRYLCRSQIDLSSLIKAFHIFILNIFYKFNLYIFVFLFSCPLLLFIFKYQA